MPEAKSQNLNVMTFNIRYNTMSDSVNAWPYRKDKVASQVLFHKAHILGVQEALHDQMMDLQERLPKYKYAGLGRDDGKEKGEYSAINDLCPHMGASLAAGYVEDGGVTCPWHAWRFCIKSGTWLDNPNSKTRTESFPVRVVGHEIQVDVPDAVPKPQPST